MKELTRISARRKLEMFGASAMAQASDADERSRWVSMQEAVGR